MDLQSLIQPIMDIQDISVPESEEGWIPMDEEGLGFFRPLWASADSGGWAAMFRWNKGFVAPAHKHLGAVHVYVISGKLKVREGTMNKGDYVYEPNGVLHDAVTALEDTVHLNIGDGPVLFYDDENLQGYFGWEQVEGARRALAE